MDSGKLLKACQSKTSYWQELKDDRDDSIIGELLKYQTLCFTQGYSMTLQQMILERGVLAWSTSIDPSGKREANIWKFIALLRREEKKPGFSYLEFITSGVEASSTEDGGGEADATPVIEPKRVNLMTVHASKGLQFEHVLIPGMSRKPQYTNTLSWHVDNETKQWSVALKDEENSLQPPLSLQLARQELNAREKSESMRQFYVALTRAKRGVNLFFEANPKNNKDSWQSLVSFMSTSPGLHEQEKFSYRVRDDLFEMTPFSLAQLNEREPRALYTSVEASRQIEKTSVTAMLDQAAGKGFSLPPQKLLLRARQGTEAHFLFEVLKYQPFSVVYDLANSEQKAALDFLKDSREPEILKLIEVGYVEWGFALQEGQSLMQGQVDLWAYVDDCLYVVDYKTGSQAYLDKAFAQLEIYAGAIRKINKLRPQRTELVVVYPMDRIIKTRTLTELSVDGSPQG